MSYFHSLHRMERVYYSFVLQSNLFALMHYLIYYIVFFIVFFFAQYIEVSLKFSLSSSATADGAQHKTECQISSQCFLIRPYAMMLPYKFTWTYTYMCAIYIQAVCKYVNQVGCLHYFVIMHITFHLFPPFTMHFSFFCISKTE